MAKKANLDAMIPREDPARKTDDPGAAWDAGDEFKDFPISYLGPDSPYLKLLRKPNFQRETNHWSPEQIATFIASFVDYEVIPSLILWGSPGFIFVLDGGHRLSALRAWVEDDYGDKSISREFYDGEIPDLQKRIAKRTRELVEARVGRYTDLKKAVSGTIQDAQTRRANNLIKRALTLQWVRGDSEVAERSFYKINSQGTPLDDIETALIKNREKPIAISARAILRAGSGHKYWASFTNENQGTLESTAKQIYEDVFQPELDQPWKSLDVPLGGSVSPVDALALLIELLAIAGTKQGEKPRPIDGYDDDKTGDETVGILTKAAAILERISGNSGCSLGLHPAVYFYNEKGKYSRFLFLGIAALIGEKLRNNDDSFFKKFTKARSALETFLIENKSLIGILLQNMGKSNRVANMRGLFQFLVTEFANGHVVKPEHAIAHLGLRGRFIDVKAQTAASRFSDDARSTMYINKALKNALKCPECNGLLDPKKSISYDHRTRVREGGSGDPENGDLYHPYCNTGIKG